MTLWRLHRLCLLCLVACGSTRDGSTDARVDEGPPSPALEAARPPSGPSAMQGGAGGPSKPALVPNAGGSPEMSVGEDVALIGNAPPVEATPSPSGAQSPGGASPDVAACPASATATPGDVTQSIVVDGVTRSFIRHVPPSYTGATPVPVVIDFHPRGASAATWRSATGWDTVADAVGFIVIWPDGIENSWNVGERCCGPAHDQNVDDLAFSRALIAALQRDACVDARRIYATGCSNGGGMAYHLACSAAEVIAAIAPVDFDCTTGPSNDPSCGNCAPVRPISQTQFRGTNDQVVPYAGGVSGVNSAIVFPGAAANFETWGQINACTGTPQPLADQPSCQTYSTCGAGVETTLCSVQGGTHCGSYDAFDIAQFAWQRLSKASLP